MVDRKTRTGKVVRTRDAACGREVANALTAALLFYSDFTPLPPLVGSCGSENVLQKSVLCYSEQSINSK